MSFNLKSELCLCCFCQVDVPAVCADKVMKAALKHIEIIAKAREKGMHHATERLLVLKSGEFSASVPFIYINLPAVKPIS